MSATLKELELVSEFRYRLEGLSLDEHNSSDLNLLRYIRAREYDLSKAEDMLRKHLQWKRTKGIGLSLVLDYEAPLFLRETYASKLMGFDDVGCPILLMEAGKWDIRKPVNDGLKEELEKLKDQSLERVMWLMRKKGSVQELENEEITQFVAICDWQGFSLRYIMNREVVDFIMEFARSFEANYPERLKAAYNVNAPKVFSVLFNLVKPILSARTLSKIFIFDSNEVAWKKEIFGNLPLSQVLTQYGGTRKDSCAIPLHDQRIVQHLRKNYSGSQNLPIIFEDESEDLQDNNGDEWHDLPSESGDTRLVAP